MGIFMIVAKLIKFYYDRSLDHFPYPNFDEYNNNQRDASSLNTHPSLPLSLVPTGVDLWQFIDLLLAHPCSYGIPHNHQQKDLFLVF